MVNGGEEEADSSGLTKMQQVFIVLGGLVAGGLVASVLMLCKYLWAKDGEDHDEEDDIGDEPTSVDGTEM